jgi:hypothetical protein
MVSFSITSIPAKFNTMNHCIGPVENCDLYVQSWNGVKAGTHPKPSLTRITRIYSEKMIFLRTPDSTILQSGGVSFGKAHGLSVIATMPTVRTRITRRAGGGLCCAG